MGYEDDPYRDEDGESLMDYDDIQSDPDPEPHHDDALLDDYEDEGDGGDWLRRERSQTPVYDNDSSKSKPRKRLIKKGDTGRQSVAPELEDEVAEDEYEGGARFAREGSEEGRKRKKGKEGGSMKKEKRLKGEKRFASGGSGKSGSKFGGSKKGFGGKGGKDHDGEVKEMWDTIAGGDSEDDHEGVRNVDDDNFIDDTGLEAGGYYGSDEPRSPGDDAPQAEEGEEDDEIKDLFKIGKKKKKNERSPAEIALLVENVMAELEVTAEEDAELNRQGKPAINKLKKLDLLTEVLSKKQLQLEFLDHGVLTLLKNWLEPLPDGSLPNINIRTAILNILNDFPIDLEQYDRREQLKKSGLGKVIMFLSKSDEEINVNRKLAKELVDKWVSNLLANKVAGMESRDGDLDLEFSQPRSGRSSSRQHASRPEATPLDFVIRPQSKIDPEEVRARAKAAAQDQQRMKMNKKLQQLRAPKKKQLQATKLSVEGRGMIKYL
ncbi:protein IWS1 homolog 1 [Arachis hypogaea]